MRWILQKQIINVLMKKLNNHLDLVHYILEFNKEDKYKNYFLRLEDELNVINNMGFSGYFLIVSDFVRWSKLNSIPVVQGRGS